MTAHWFAIGKFQILAKPLPLNPAFLTHHIYLGKDCIGKQLSVPSIDDCENRLREHRSGPEKCSNFRPYTEFKNKQARNGRRAA